MNTELTHDLADVLFVGDLQVNTRTHNVSRENQVLDLPDLSYRLLLSLARHAPGRVSKETLIEEVWQGLVVSDETLTQRVRLLRHALDDSSQQPRYIASIRNQGYRLIADVSSNHAQDEADNRPHQANGSGKMLVIAASLIALSLAAAGFWFSTGTKPVSLTRLAVLPFTDLSPDNNKAYFADGFHEELVSRLADIQGLGVISRTSVLPFRSSPLSATEIANHLGATVLLEGSVRLAGNRLRITTQLIDGETDEHLWAESFERELTMENLFAIQEEVAERIANTLKVELMDNDPSRMVRLPTVDLETYDLYLLGRFNTFTLESGNLSKAVDLLQQALARDDQFAEAWATLGWAFAFQGSGYAEMEPREVYPKAREAALRALALDPELGDAHSLYADILTWYDWDWDAAEREYIATTARDPDNVLGYALFLSTQLRHEEATRLVDQLTTRFPASEYIHINAAWRYLNARNYGKALEEASLAGSHAEAGAVAGWALLSSGRENEALVLFEANLAKNPGQANALSDLAIAAIRTGDTERGQVLLQQLLRWSTERYVRAETIAAVYFALHDPDQGFEWLNTAFKNRSRGLIFLQVDHVYDAYRSDPRYLELHEKMKFKALKMLRSG